MELRFRTEASINTDVPSAEPWRRSRFDTDIDRASGSIVQSFFMQQSPDRTIKTAIRKRYLMKCAS
ncbi:MAG: hypothetical protein WAV76_08725 [Bacteroidota bacterium]